MSLRSTSDWTYGVELEFPDVNVHAALPDGWRWSKADYSIVNSDGRANDPLRQLVGEGGELNSPPFSSVDELAAGVQEVWKLLRPGWNYRSNLHIHVRVPGLFGDVGKVQRLAAFTRRHLPSRWAKVDPLDGLTRGLQGDALVAARKRQRHSERSRHYFIPEARHKLRMAAASVSEALEAEVPHTKGGRPLWHLAPREAVNLRSLRKHNTTEFRCFAAPRCPEHVMAAALFVQGWTEQAFADGDPDLVVRPLVELLPKQARFEHHLELGWEYTTFKHRTRLEVATRLKGLGLL